MSATLCRRLNREDERQAARDVIERVYAAQGYISDTIASYLGPEHSATFGLFAKETLFGTISVVHDSARGLPMDSIYADELAPWRTQHKRLAEVVQFAVDHEQYTALTGEKASPFVATPLFSATLEHAIEEKIEHLCIAIHPKHDRFYHLLGFEKIGELKQYDSANAPAIARALYIPGHRTRVLGSFLGQQLLRHATV